MKLILREDQISSLMRNYRSLNEQAPTGGFNPETKTETIDFKSVWSSGRWKVTATQVQSMNAALSPLVEFLKSNPMAKVNIEIIAGESQVTNFDREKMGCGNGVYSEACKLQPGVLSNNRAQSVYDFLLKKFQDLKTNGLIQTMPNTPTKKTVIGTTAYNPKVDKASDQKYTNEQFVKLNISATASYDCLIGMDITVSYEKGSGHQCDEAIFGLKVNGQLLGIVNLNNGRKDVGQEQVPGVVDIEQAIYNHNKRIVDPLVNPWAQREYKNWLDNRAKTRIARFADAIINVPELGIENKKASDFTEGPRAPRITSATSLRLHLVLLYIEKNDFEGKVVYNPDAVVDDTFIATMKGFGDHKGKKMSEVDTVGNTVKALKNLAGRETDNQVGGRRAQTFKLDTSMAQNIVQNASVKDKLIFSLVPKVDRTGPYKMFFNQGSHSEVPTVKIVGREGDVRFQGRPNLKMDRGAMAETVILQTDLCGKTITNQQ